MSLETLAVGRAILLQLGGSKFLAMTGSHSFIMDGDHLTFRLRRNQSKGNIMKITLTVMDNYNIEVFRAGRNRVTKQYERVCVAFRYSVYADQLQGCFKEITGMDTHL
jgi:hypothetical protein